MNLLNLMQVFRKVADLDRVSVAVGLPPESVSDDVEEMVGSVSDLFLKKKQTWKHLEDLLKRSNEMEAVETVVLMKNYICEGTQYSLKYVCICSMLNH